MQNGYSIPATLKYTIIFCFPAEGRNSVAIIPAPGGNRLPKRRLLLSKNSQRKRISDIIKGHDSDDCWECVNYYTGDYQIEMLRAIAADNGDTIIDFFGSSGVNEITVRPADKAAIRNILKAYDLLSQI